MTRFSEPPKKNLGQHFLHDAGIVSRIVQAVDPKPGELLVEIQTGSFGSLRHKLERLTRHHRVRLVAPVPLLRTIVRVSDAPSAGTSVTRLGDARGEV